MYIVLPAIDRTLEVSFSVTKRKLILLTLWKLYKVKY